MLLLYTQLILLLGEKCLKLSSLLENVVQLLVHGLVELTFLSFLLPLDTFELIFCERYSLEELLQAEFILVSFYGCQVSLLKLLFFVTNLLLLSIGLLLGQHTNIVC